MSYVLIDEKRLERISEGITFIADFIRSIFEEKTKRDTDRLLTNTEAAELLNVSTRTLARMRANGSIAYSIVNTSASAGTSYTLSPCTSGSDGWLRLASASSFLS